MQKAINNEQKEYKDFIKKHSKGHFMQGPEWAAVKDNWKHEVIVVRDNQGNIKGAMSILIRKVPFLKYSLMYSPRGPVCDPHDYETIKELLNQARELAKKYKAFVLKMDPDIKKSDQKFLEIAQSLGFKIKNEAKNFEGIQPRFVFRLDLKDKSEEDIMMAFHSKTRYNIRLAMRRGVEVKIGTREDLKVFHEVMQETGIRDGFVIRNLEYFEKMYDCLGSEHLRLYLAYYEGKVIAGTIAILYGNKCWYLYGASSNEYRNVMPNYLLQWEMIRWAVEAGCDIYDFRGVSGDLDESNPLYGLYKFKKGFNGEFTEFVGDLDFVFNPFIKFAVENGEKVFRELRRRLFLLKSKGKVS